MDIISFNEAATANSRIEKINANPDSTSGIVTVPKVIASGETITIPAGRVAILPNVQIDGVLNVEGEVFIPSGATLSTVVEKVTSTDNAIVRFDGTTGKVQNSGVVIDDSNNTILPTNRFVVFGTSTTPSQNYHIGGVASDSSLRFYNGNYGSGTERVRIDTVGSLLLTSGTGGLGYGTGSGGTVTQLTNKGTTVILDKPTGRIIMNNAALAAGATTAFTFVNNKIYETDIINVVSDNGNYIVWGTKGIGGCAIWVKNNHTASLSDAIVLNFTVIKGAIS